MIPKGWVLILIVASLFITGILLLPAGEIHNQCPDYCNDSNPCTLDYCDKSTNYTCANLPLDGDYEGCSSEQDCKRETCISGLCEEINISGCCGNGVCEHAEDCSACPEDCFCGDGFECENSTCVKAAVCGNEICEEKENCSSCSQDCGICEGISCRLQADCPGGYCVHAVCRFTSPYCGDKWCDRGETRLTCSNDCGEPLNESEEGCNEDSDCLTGHCVHRVCRDTSPYCGDTYCDVGESADKCEEDCSSVNSNPPCVGGKCIGERCVDCGEDCSLPEGAVCVRNYECKSDVCLYNLCRSEDCELSKWPEDCIPESSDIQYEADFTICSLLHNCSQASTSWKDNKDELDSWLYEYNGTGSYRVWVFTLAPPDENSTIIVTHPNSCYTQLFLSEQDCGEAGDIKVCIEGIEEQVEN